MHYRKRDDYVEKEWCGMRKILYVAALLLLSVTLEAQPPLTIEWDQDGVTPTEAQAYIYTYFLDNTAGVDLQAVVCGVNNNKTVCAAPFPSPSVGVHTVYLVVRNEYGSSPPSPTLRFRYPLVPGAPTNLRIVRGD